MKSLNLSRFQLALRLLRDRGPGIAYGRSWGIPTTGHRFNSATVMRLVDEGLAVIEPCRPAAKVVITDAGRMQAETIPPPFTPPIPRGAA